jgi:hypothetical protein
MEIHREHAAGAGLGDHVGHELGADGHARLVLAVLARVSEVGDDGVDAGRRRPVRRVDQQQQLDDVVTGRGGALDDEQVAAADVFVDADEDLSVRELLDGDLAERKLQVLGDLPGERKVGRAGQQHGATARECFRHC